MSDVKNEPGAINPGQRLPVPMARAFCQRQNASTAFSRRRFSADFCKANPGKQGC
jgi:hypothetical protein